MKTGSYESILAAIDEKISGAGCAGCGTPQRWQSIRNLLLRCKSAINELLALHRIDQAEIIRLRRMVEAEAEKNERKG